MHQLTYLILLGLQDRKGGRRDGMVSEQKPWQSSYCNTIDRASNNHVPSSHWLIFHSISNGNINVNTNINVCIDSSISIYIYNRCTYNGSGDKWLSQSWLHNKPLLMWGCHRTKTSSHHHGLRAFSKASSTGSFIEEESTFLSCASLQHMYNIGTFLPREATILSPDISI